MKHLAAKSVVASLSGVLLYVLSIGPVMRWLDYDNLPLNHAVAKFYEPIYTVARRNGEAMRRLEDYIEFWLPPGTGWGLVDE